MNGTSAAAVLVDLPPSTRFASLETWFNALPAQDRASLRWFAQVLETLREDLVKSPITEESLHAIALRYQDMVIRLRAWRWSLQQPSWLIEDHPDARHGSLEVQLGSPIAATQIELAEGIVKGFYLTFSELVREDAIHSSLVEFMAQTSTEHLSEALAQNPAFDLVRAQVLLQGVFECIDRGGLQERAIELGRRALLCALHGITKMSRLFPPALTKRIRLHTRAAIQARHDETIDQPQASDADQLLVATTQKWLLESEEPIAILRGLRIGPPRPASPSGAAPPKLRKLLGELVGIRFDSSSLSLKDAEGEHTFYVTPALLERALSLRGQPVAALLVTATPSGFQRLLRLDPVEGPTIPSGPERTRELIEQHGELLHRLAQ
ncbi:hypothetical protein [Chondromyces apiculatus]|uniref:hypothetical protein n=1 Tax=Chondromyces apiculatus TaxID=51 RepID=UPI0005C664FB|nr:hypothetical protein [Chondromyces apiculatus]